MNGDIFSILIEMQDMQRYLTYIFKNSHFDDRAKQVADDRYWDIRTAIANCRRVLDEVLIEQHKACG